MNYNKFLLFGLLTLILTSCSTEFSRLMKSSDPLVVIDGAKNYYDKEKYTKASDLLSHATPLVAGRPEAKDAMHLGAKIAYDGKDYITAGSRYRSYYEQLPKNDSMREEALFLSSKSYYNATPKYNLDQSGTNEAIEMVQDFINRYPNSKYLDEANGFIKTMRNKLEKKAYMNSYGYYKMGNYKSAIESFKYFVEDFPDSQYREDAYYYLFKSRSIVALNSIPQLKKERLEETKATSKRIMDLYPNTSYKEEMEKIHNKVVTELEKHISDEQL